MSNTLDKKYSFRQVKLLRASILLLLAFISIIGNYFYYTYDLTYTLYVGIAFTVSMIVCAILYVQYNLFFLGRYLGFSLACAICFLFSYVEGFESLAFLYFLALLVIISILITKKEAYFKQALLFYGTFAVFLILTLVLTPYKSIENYSPHQIDLLKKLNLSLVFTLIIFYSVFGLIQERWYYNKVKKGAAAAEDLKNKRMIMLSNLGHEIRTLGTSINAATNMLSETEVTPKQKPLVEVLNYCTNQMFYLINDILDLRKIETGKFSLQLSNKNISKILSIASVPFREPALQKKLELKTTIDEQLKEQMVLVDEVRMNQVLHNLLSNALKYTNAGSITLSSKLVKEDTTGITLYIEVADTGIGIKEENRDKIFDSFWQIKEDDVPIYGGSGLGLTIAANIVQQMGGELKVDSRFNEGSRFYFTITLAKGSASANSASLQNIEKLLSGKDILIADDNGMSLTFATKILQQKGVNVHQAKNGLEAIEALKANPSISIILLDLEMPEMNGYTAIAGLKSINPQVKVIAFTANIPDVQFIEKLHQLGFADVLSKPFEPKILYKKVQQYLS